MNAPYEYNAHVVLAQRLPDDPGEAIVIADGGDHTRLRWQVGFARQRDWIEGRPRISFHGVFATYEEAEAFWKGLVTQMTGEEFDDSPIWDPETQNFVGVPDAE